MVASATSVDAVSAVGWKFDNTYARLSEVFVTPAAPAKVSDPRLAIVNSQLANAWDGAARRQQRI